MPVAGHAAYNLPYTIELTVARDDYGPASGMPLGVVSATRHRNKADFGVAHLRLLGYAVPDFYLGALLLIGCRSTSACSRSTAAATGFIDRLYHVFLPALTLALVKAAFVGRLTRTSLLEVLGKDYIRTARAKGARENRGDLPARPAQRAAAADHRPGPQHPRDAVGLGRDRTGLQPPRHRQAC